MAIFMNRLLMIFLVFAIAAASFEGFFVKWSFRDADFQAEKYSFAAMYDATGHRPFVHRQLLIDVSKGFAELLPTETKAALVSKLKADNFLADKFKEVDLQERFLLEYYMVYALSFLCLFASIFIWRRICIDLTGDAVAGTLAPLAFTIIFPYLETFGGYFYDFSELLFFALATWFALRGNWLALILMTPLAELNKESFFFFLATLYPLLRRTQSTRRTLLIIGGAKLLAGLTYLTIINRFADNAGGMVESHIMGNVIAGAMFSWFMGAFFLSKKINGRSKPLSYIVFAILVAIPFIVRGVEYPLPFGVFDTFGHTYSVVGGERAFLLHVALILWVVKSAWHFLDVPLKHYALLSLAVNTPLIVLFGAVFELRNWSLTYPAFIVLLTFYIKDAIDRHSKFSPQEVQEEWRA